ncbi:MAG TPA: ATPase domain-containing protein [Terracidiphilus sp.]|nr:ATPase domain-containing protein [Terracidiphilus sp.]
MPAAAALRQKIEFDLKERFPAALSPAPRASHEVAHTGIDAVDRVLEGGLPLGAICEITGPACSGRTSLALAFLAQRTDEGRVCAWVDNNDALDPESAAASGVNLKQLLWVRCGDERLRAARRAGRFGIREGSRPWARLDQALRATDLLLQAGGFAAIVLDLADTAVEHGGRIPLATWFRFRQAADRTRCCLLVLGKAAYSQSSAALELQCLPARAETAGDTVLRGFRYELRRGRQRFFLGAPGARKLPASTWSASTAWKPETWCDAEERA